MTDKTNLQAALPHVLWIGGATDAGKTTAATLLAEKHGLQTYHYDRPLKARADRVHDPKTEAKIILWHNMTEDERWLREPETIKQHIFDMWFEGFHAVIDDLLSLPNHTKIVAEGYGFIPELIGPLLSQKNQAIWLVPTEVFKRNSFDRRVKSGNKAVYENCSDPERARKNLFARDLLIGEHVTKEVKARGLKLLEIAGGLEPEAVVNVLEQHFTEYL